MSDGMGREPAYLSSHATNRYFIPNWGIVLLVLLSICLLQVSHAVPYPVWRAAADYLFLRAKGGFPAGMIMGQETLAASCPFSLYI